MREGEGGRREEGELLEGEEDEGGGRRKEGEEGGR
jgi:hypothetical protein